MWPSPPREHLANCVCSSRLADGSGSCTGRRRTADFPGDQLAPVCATGKRYLGAPRDRAHGVGRPGPDS